MDISDDEDMLSDSDTWFNSDQESDFSGSLEKIFIYFLLIYLPTNIT